MSLIEEFDDLTLTDDETHDLDMSDHFSGEDLTYTVEVTTTYQGTGQTKKGPLNEIALNKLTGEWDDDEVILTLEGGHAPSQTLTVKITATDANGNTAKDEFTITLENP